MNTLITRPCQCENAAHFDKAKRTPAGNPGHKYGTNYTERSLAKVKTPYGTFEVCLDCSEDCLHKDDK